LTGNEDGERRAENGQNSLWTVVLLLLRLRTNHIDALAIEAWPTLACMISLIGGIFIGGIDEDVRERTII
jgi:hypothetical protein